LHNKQVKAVPHIPCYAGQSWEWDGVRFHFLHPLPSAQGKPNALSCTLHIAATHHTLLLPGDIERAQEQSILDRAAPETIRASVLLMPHHGSKTSSSIEWLEAVQPKIAIAQVGYLNRFRHPRPEILLRYTQRDIKVLRSDYHGAIEVHTDGEHIEWQSWRQRKRRYWHWQS
jgi:competence protein ComEC